MYTKATAMVFVAVLVAVLITSVVVAADNADARRHRHSSSDSQALSQLNDCDSSNCQNAASQIQGDGNSVSISVSN